MKKAEFLRTLERNLMALPVQERRDILADFEEHFNSGQALGKSEEEVARELGDPQTLAGQYVELPAPQQNGGNSVVQSVFAAFALLLFDVILVIPIFSTLLGIWLGLWGIDLGLGLGGLGALVASVLPWWVTAPSMLARMGLFLLALAVIAMAVLMGIGMVYVTKWSLRGLIGFVKAHVRIIKGGA